MINIPALISAAVLNGTPLMYGTCGEIITEKSGNLNLGVEGLMFMGGAFGLAGAFIYEQIVGEAAIGFIAIVIAIICSFLAGVLGSLIFSFVTISLRANQNVTGLALTIFGTGVGQFVGEYMRVKVGGYVSLGSGIKTAFDASPFPQFLQDIPVLGQILFSYNIFVYLGILICVLSQLFIFKHRYGLNLRAVGESPATADAAGVNVTKYKYLATLIGGGISAMGGMVYIMTIAGCVWNHEALSGEGWLAVALVIFCLWKPKNAIRGSIVFGLLMILYIRLSIPIIPSELYKILPYVATIIVLIMVSLRQKRLDQPPASLGLPYFREER